MPGGAAEDDGRLQAGDQILCVDKISLIDITQEQYVDKSTGKINYVLFEFVCLI